MREGLGVPWMCPNTHGVSVNVEEDLKCPLPPGSLSARASLVRCSVQGTVSCADVVDVLCARTSHG